MVNAPDRRGVHGAVSDRSATGPAVRTICRSTLEDAGGGRRSAGDDADDRGRRPRAGRRPAGGLRGDADRPATTLATLQAALVRRRSTRRRCAPPPSASVSRGASPSPQRRPGARRRAGAHHLAATRRWSAFPAETRVAEGQFAFLPGPEASWPDHPPVAGATAADVTVEVRNGSGKVGVGEAVVRRARQPRREPPVAAQRRQLRLPADADPGRWPDALPVARDIRAILGRGVVLDGATCRSDTVVVIVGDDFKLRNPAKGPAVAARARTHDGRASWPATSPRYAADKKAAGHRRPQHGRRRHATPTSS